MASVLDLPFHANLRSWLNAIENFSTARTRQQPRRGSFHSIADLEAAIKPYLAEHNAQPRPFV